MRADLRVETSKGQLKCKYKTISQLNFIIRGDFEYDLYLKNDYGTGGFTQWYYFKVQNTRKNHTYRFNIVNLMKPDSTYTNGMRPLIYSVKEAEATGIGWQRDGFNIAYYQNARKSMIQIKFKSY